MSQNGIVLPTTGTVSGLAMTQAVNNALQDLGTQFAGPAALAVPVAYQRAARTDLGVVRRRNASNTSDVLDGTLAESLVPARASNTILGLADHMTVIEASGTWTQTFTAAATMTAGWEVGYRNVGSGVITLDPNASETIDGATTIALNPGESCFIYCDGTGFVTIGRVAAVANAAPGSSSFAFRNAVINGCFRVQQMGASNLAAGFTYGTADLHMIAVAGGTGISGTDAVSSGLAGIASGNMYGTMAGTWANGQFSYQHRMEAKHTFRFNGNTVMCAVKVYQNSGVAKNFRIALYKPSTTADTFSAQTVLQTSAALSVPSGVITPISAPFVLGASDASLGLALYVYEDVVSTVASKAYLIGEPQVIPGGVVTPFELPDISLVLTQCQRRLRKSFSQGTAPVQSGGANGTVLYIAGKAGAASEFGYVPLNPPMANANYTVTLYNPSAANAQARDFTANADCSATAAIDPGDSGFSITCTGNAGTAVGNAIGVHYLIDDRL